MKSMKAAVLYGVNDLRVEEKPIPEPRAGEVLVRIKQVGVCGTDVHMWAGTNFEGEFPFVPGHEWVGVVEKMGPGVRSIKVGDRVTGECFIPCGTCPVCKEGGLPVFCPNHDYYGFQPDNAGGMAEYHRSPEIRLVKIHDSLSDDEACLIEPVSVAYRAVWGRGGGAGPHDRIGIIGAGPIGLFAMQICLVSGAQVVVFEPAAYRQKMARDMGARTIIDPSRENVFERVMELTEGLGLTLLVECSGSVEGIASTVDIVAVDGRIVLTGQSMGTKIPTELGKLIWNNAVIVGANGSQHYYRKTMAYLSRKLADPAIIITHRFPFDKIQEAFALGNKGTESGKIMLELLRSDP